MRTLILSIFLCCGFAAMALAEAPPVLSPQTAAAVNGQIGEMRALGIPGGQARQMLLQMVQNHYPEQTWRQAAQVVMDAAKTGLPTDPVVSKAMEGMAKQIDAQQILAAMEMVRDRYAVAGRLATSIVGDRKAKVNLTVVIADSLAAGMLAEDMDAIMAQLHVRQAARGGNDGLALKVVQTARGMARLGMKSDVVAELLGHALRQGYTGDQIEQLCAQTRRAVHGESALQMADPHSAGKGNAAGNTGAGSGNGAGGGGASDGGGGSGGGSGNGGSR